MTTQSQATAQSSVPNDISQELSTFNGLTADEKLGVLWVIYTNMGGSITEAGPGAAGDQFTQRLLDRVKSMDESAQMTFMRDLIEHKKTSDTEAYSNFSDDTKLVFWYQLSEEMAAGTVVQVPDDYTLNGDAAQVYSKVENLEFNQQLTFLRYAVIDMGV